MLPLKKVLRLDRPHVLMRVGANSLQVWLQERSLTLRLLREFAIEGSVTSPAKFDESLLAAQNEIPDRAIVDVVMDSKWMPLCWLPLGRQAIGAEARKAFADQRFTQIFGDVATGWIKQVDFYPGSRGAIAFACANELIHRISSAVKSKPDRRLSLRSIGPTYGWLSQLASRFHHDNLSCIVFTEQDRTIYTFQKRGKIVGIHPCGPKISNMSSSPDVSAKQMARQCALVLDSSDAVGFALERPLLSSQVSPGGWFFAEVEEAPR